MKARALLLTPALQRLRVWLAEEADWGGSPSCSMPRVLRAARVVAIR